MNVKKKSFQSTQKIRKTEQWRLLSTDIQQVWEALEISRKITNIIQATKNMLKYTLHKGYTNICSLSVWETNI